MSFMRVAPVAWAPVAWAPAAWAPAEWVPAGWGPAGWVGGGWRGARRAGRTVPPTVAGRGIEVLGFDLAGPALGSAGARDESCPLQDLEVLGDRLLRHGEGLGELVHRRLTAGQPRQDGPPRRIGERREREAQVLVDDRHRTAPPASGEAPSPLKAPGRTRRPVSRSARSWARPSSCAPLPRDQSRSTARSSRPPVSTPKYLRLFGPATVSSTVLIGSAGI